MKNFIVGIQLFFVQLLLVSSCTDVVEVEVPDSGERLVVEASFKWEKETAGQTQSIFLSASSTYFEQNNNAPVRGAMVLVTKDDDGSQFVFEDQNNGTYITTDFVPELNQSYTLEIDYNGNTYEASEVLKSISPINRVEQTDGSGFGDGDIGLNVYFDDPIGIDNYYLAEFKASNQPLISLEAEDDSFTDGNENFLAYGGEDLETDVIVDIELQGISEGYYNYMAILIEQSGGEGRPFPTTPVQLKGNCKNINDPNEEVLGFFRLSEVVREQVVVE